MPYELGAKVRELVPYDPIAGAYPIRLDANESFISLPEHLRQQFAHSLTEFAYNRYPDPYCVALRQAFGAYYGVDPARVTVSNGSDELISIILSCLLTKGDRLLSVSPDFSMYRFYAQLYELDSVVVSKDENLAIDVNELLRVAEAQQAATIIFSNPCNPTSLLLAREQVLRLVSGTKALVVVDEAYMDFTDGSLLDVAHEYDNLIILRTCSKAVGLAGVRLGFAVASPQITGALQAAKSPYNVNAISQQLGLLVFQNPAYIDQAVQDLVNSRLELQANLEALAALHPALEQVFPSSANFIFVRAAQAGEIHGCLLDKGIVVRCFDGHLRITAGAPQENAALYKALEEILPTLPQLNI